MAKLARVCWILLLFALMAAFPVFAGMEMSGFVDAMYQGQEGEKGTFGMGSFEIDFGSEFSPRIAFEGAVVIEGDKVSLGQTMLDFMLMEEDRLGLQIGLLDMPFGIDYQVFATPDRKTVTPPLITELMMDGGWGDIGLNFHGSFPRLNYNLYVVNGMGEDGGKPVNQLLDNNSAKTVGGRIGILPLQGLELGFSYGYGPYLEGSSKEALSRMGGDFQFVHDPLEIKGEYIKGKEDIAGGGENEHDGFYIQLLGKATEKLYGVTRYDFWKPKGGDSVNRVVLTAGYDVIENVSLRAEYQINSETPSVKNNLFCVQAVISF